MSDLRRFVLRVHLWFAKIATRSIQICDFPNDYMVAGLSTETNKKSAETIGNQAYFKKMKLQSEFGFEPHLANGGAVSLTRTCLQQT